MEYKIEYKVGAGVTTYSTLAKNVKNEIVSLRKCYGQRKVIITDISLVSGLENTILYKFVRGFYSKLCTFVYRNSYEPYSKRFE